MYAGPEPPAGYTLDTEADGILRTVGEAGFDRFHLVGYSGGGASSAAFAAAHPERLLSLALIEPAWLGNEGLGAEEQAVWRRFEQIMDLPPEQLMPAFVANQLAPGVEPPPPPAGPPPPWMAARPAGLRSFLETFLSSSLDLDRLRAFAKPVLFVLGGRSNPDYYGREAERAREHLPRLHPRSVRGAPPLRPAAPDRTQADSRSTPPPLGSRAAAVAAATAAMPPPLRRDQRGQPIELPLGANLLDGPDGDIRRQDAQEQRIPPRCERDREHPEHEQNPVRNRERVRAQDARVRAARAPPRQPPPCLQAMCRLPLGQPGRSHLDARHDPISTF